MESDQGVVNEIIKQSSEAGAAAETKAGAKETPAAPPKETKILTAEENVGRAEVSVATIGRMLGLATKAEISLLESKVDLLSTKLTNMTVRFDKVQSTLQGVSTGSDLERVDVQIGALKSILADLVAQVGTLTGTPNMKKENGVARNTAKAKIVSSEGGTSPSAKAEENPEG